MSTAEQRVRAYSHPQVKGSVRAVLDAIAKRIPEGETMTAVIPIGDLATETGYDPRTMKTALNLLVALLVIRIVGGGRGKQASYELLLLPGSGADPSLPLIGRTPRPRPPVEPLPFLDQPAVDDDVVGAPAVDVRAYDVGSFFLRWVTNVGSFFLRYRDQTLRFSKRRKKDPTLAATSDPTLAAALPPLEVPIDDARARTRYTQDQDPDPHTRAGPPIIYAPTASPPVVRRRRQVCSRRHAWCEGRVHVPRELHSEHLRKWNRLPGESDIDREDRIFAVYAKCLSTIPDDQPITDANEFDFWRREIAEEWASASPPTARAPTPTVPRVSIPVDLYKLADEQRRQRRGGSR